MSFFTSIFFLITKRIRRARLRKVIRGYRIVKKFGQLDRIPRLKEALTEYKLDISKENFSKFLMGVGAGYGEIVVRQYVLTRLGGINLNVALLHSIGGDERVLFPLPKEWRKVLEQHDFKVAHLRSAILWQCYLLAIWLYGILKIIKVIIAGIVAKKAGLATQGNYAYFIDLVPSNLPKKFNNIKSYDVISWYLQWSGRKHGITEIRHSAVQSECININGVNIFSQPSPLPALNVWMQVVRYVLWALTAIVVTAFDCLRGRWWHVLLLNQCALAFQAKIVSVDSLAREYLFHNSGWIYRPLWTYEAECRGSKILFYFYSTNCESFKTSAGYPPLNYGWKAMNWPHYLVWDEYQAEFVRQAVGKVANITIVGSIWFQSSAAEMPMFDTLGIAVFDVTPCRSSFYAGLGLENEFYTPLNASHFLIHVSNIIEKNSALMMWKRKRDIGRLAHPHYRYLANLISEKPTTFLVDPNLAASLVIQSSQAVISMPFTSTALIAKEMGKPSIYYDPTGLLQRDDRAAHGIPIVVGEKELENWLLEIIGR